MSAPQHAEEELFLSQANSLTSMPTVRAPMEEALAPGLNKYDFAVEGNALPGFYLQANL